MLGNLDNEVIFKKAFANKTVFTAFVRDVLGIEIEVGTIETEKRFEPKVGFIDFKLDIYAESVDKRVIVEIQRIEYDHHFDRFLHYFIMSIAEQQRSAQNYTAGRTVYVIVILTAPYKISEKNGAPILDEVLLVKLNPQTIGGIKRQLNGHQLVFLNPNYQDKETPQSIRDWLDLIYQSIHNPSSPVLNTQNEGIKTAIEIIDSDELTSDELERRFNSEEAKITLAKERVDAFQEVARKLIEIGVSNEIMAQGTGVTFEQIDRIRKTDYSRLRKK